MIIQAGTIYRPFLAITAGADYPEWLLEELRGGSSAVTFDGWQDRLCMFRYDWSVFVSEAKLDAPSSDHPTHHTPSFD